MGWLRGTVALHSALEKSETRKLELWQVDTAHFHLSIRRKNEQFGFGGEFANMSIKFEGPKFNTADSFGTALSVDTLLTMFTVWSRCPEPQPREVSPLEAIGLIADFAFSGRRRQGSTRRRLRSTDENISSLRAMSFFI